MFFYNEGKYMIINQYLIKPKACPKIKMMDEQLK
jgi:hypothetical protein